MENIDKWLKSLRLHKYTHLFKQLTYEQMLNLDEDYLIQRNVTKGARNKMLVSVKRLNLRYEILFNMIDDLNQDNLSMKEALIQLREMLVTPIPPPYSTAINSRCQTLATTPTSASNSISPTSLTVALHQRSSDDDISSNSSSSNVSLSSPLTETGYMNPHNLTHLYVETLEKIAQRLIASAGFQDCHAIMTSIVDECLKHNSFTNGQKARVTSFIPQLRQSYCHHRNRNRIQVRHTKTNRWFHQQHQLSGNHHPHLQQQQQLQLQQQQQQQQLQLPYQQHQTLNHHLQHLQHQQQLHQEQQKQQSIQHQQQQQQQQQHQQKQQPQLQQQVQQQRLLQLHHHNYQPTLFQEYSLLGPGKTFELPCLRARSLQPKQA